MGIWGGMPGGDFITNTTSKGSSSQESLQQGVKYCLEYMVLETFLCKIQEISFIPC